MNFRPELVVLNEDVRNYSSETAHSFQNSAHSPVRVGDTFEALKRKMIPLPAVSGPDSQKARLCDLLNEREEHSECEEVAGWERLVVASDKEANVRAQRDGQECVDVDRDSCRRELAKLCVSSATDAALRSVCMLPIC